MTSALIAGGGAGGLYTAWRLLTDPDSDVTDVTIIEMSPDRVGGRIHTKTFEKGDYVDLGGMRFASNQRLINNVIPQINYSPQNIARFVESTTRLFYLRGDHLYDNDLVNHHAPYNTPYNNASVDDAFAALSAAVAGTNARTREEWCEWVETAMLPTSFPTDVFEHGDRVSNIGYWNLMFDYLGGEGYQYAADAGGYTSNVINWNAADAIPYNGEFASKITYNRFKGGYTTFIEQLKNTAVNEGANIVLNRRLISFDESGNKITAIVDETNAPGNETTLGPFDYLFLAMPKNSVEIVAQSARDNSLAKMLNNSTVKLYLESVIEQPSYKIGISFTDKWWDNCTYNPILDAHSNAWGPTITDLPLRQIYYFTPEQGAQPGNYAVLASYDDMRFTTFWQQLELSAGSTRSVPISENYESLGNGAPLTEEMKKMVALQLAEVHYNRNEMPQGYNAILGSMTEAYYMDWSLNPFGAGYHAWAAHYDICDAMQKIRQPLALAESKANVFIVGSAYSNDQAWVEGAFCTAESVLTDPNYPFKFNAIVDTSDYPLICACTT